MNKLLVVEDEVITSDLLRRYFEMVGYTVVSALTGTDAIKMATEHKPEVIILDIMLPDMDGYDICKRLRSDERTERIPIVFLTQKDERRDRLEGLSLGADDYVTKPFDIEELRLRVHNIINRMGGTPLVDARTSLPSLSLLKERLPRLLDDPESVFLDVQIDHWKDFERQYGPVAANQVVRSAAKIIGDLLHEVDPANSFVGHPRDDHFLLALQGEVVERVEKELPARFSSLIQKFYEPTDLERGKMKMGDAFVPLMAFRIMRVKAGALRSLTTTQDAAEAEQDQSRAEISKPVAKTDKPEDKQDRADKVEEIQTQKRGATVPGQPGAQKSKPDTGQSKPENKPTSEEKNKT